MPEAELNAWQATECHSELGTSGSLVADVKSLVSEARPSVDTSIVWLMTSLLPAKLVLSSPSKRYLFCYYAIMLYCYHAINNNNNTNEFTVRFGDRKRYRGPCNIEKLIFYHYYRNDCGLFSPSPLPLPRLSFAARALSTHWIQARQTCRCFVRFRRVRVSAKARFYGVIWLDEATHPHTCPEGSRVMADVPGTCHAWEFCIL